MTLQDTSQNNRIRPKKLINLVLELDCREGKVRVVQLQQQLFIEQCTMLKI